MYGFVKQCEEKLGEALGRRFFESASQVRLPRRWYEFMCCALGAAVSWWFTSPL